MRYKLFHFYHTWCEIFGKDRATREHAEDFYVADNDHLDINADKVKVEVGGCTDDFFVDDDNSFMSICQPSMNNSTDRSKSKKRK